MNLPPNVPFVWEKLPFPVESSTPYLPLPDMDLKLRALEGGKYIHLSLVPLRDFKPDEQMTMLPALEGISKDEPGFRVIVCDPDQTPPQLMLPHAMPDYATCGQTAPDDGGFRISERYLRFIFRCQVNGTTRAPSCMPFLYVYPPVPAPQPSPSRTSRH